VSIITPSNDWKWIKQAWPGVRSQTFGGWEWVILYNGPQGEQAAAQADVDRWNTERDSFAGRVVFRAEYQHPPRVGALKRRCCELARGDYVVELDHDDQLSVDCLDRVVRAFEEGPGERPVFVYSSDVRVNADGTPNVFGEGWGWEYAEAVFHGAGGDEKHKIPVTPPVLPQNVSRIWYAPDHVRAWDRKAYWRAGGHDMEQEVCDDQDLMCRLYSLGRFAKAEGCLYRYLVHGGNTWLKNQQKIQDLTVQLHDRYIEGMALARCVADKLGAFDLGGAFNCPAGWTSVDKQGAMVLADLDKRWPWDDSTVGALRAHDVFEHLRDPVHVMNEAWRVLVHGGLLLVEVPSTDGRGAFQAPDHVSWWNTNSFFYWTREEQQKYVRHLGAAGKFQLVRALNYAPNPWCQMHNIVYAKVHLAAVKGGPRMHGALEI